jgi:insulysin
LQTSEYDNRLYLPLNLKNGLDVLLVHDQECKKNAVSMAIQAGHFRDPENFEGLLHLLEHMLFLGNKAYPEANGLSEYLSHHGGNINAWTGTEFSNFHFEVPSFYLPQSMEQFCQMLSAPLLVSEQIEKEICSIDAEYKLKKKDDLRRLYQVHKETCNPAHPFSQFSVGNKETLGQHAIDELADLLRNVHRDFFIASNMRLCIVSDIPLEILKELTEQCFSKIRSAKLPEQIKLPALYLPEQLGVKIHIQPIQRARRLIISFALPDTLPFYRSKPLGLISHIIGDEGHGSLLHYFKQKNWATSLSAGGGIQGSNFKDYNLNLQLTEYGLEKIDDILETIFSYMAMLRRNVTESWRYQEKITLAKQAFDFGDASKSIDDAIHYANQMFNYPIEHVIAGDYLLDEPDTESVFHLLDFICPTNMRVKIIHPNAKTNRRAKWYRTPFAISPIAPSLLAKLHNPANVEQLSLPQQNPYIVQNTHLKPLDKALEYPCKIVNTQGLDLWFGQDHKFKQPKGDGFLSFDCAVVAGGVEVSTYKRLWVAMLMEEFSQEYYQAGVAGLNYHLYPHQAGFSLHTNGFSQKQLDLCMALFERLNSAHNFERYFEQIRNKHWQALQNTLVNKPINRLFNRLSVILQRYSYAPVDMLPVVENATIEHIVQVQKQMFSEVFIEGFLHGDWTQKQAQNLGEFLSLKRDLYPCGNRIPRDVINLCNSERHIHQVSSQHDDSAAVIYFQSPSASKEDTALTILTEQLIASPFFNTLRTEKQLGYLVGSGYMPFNQHPGMAFYVQSPTTSAGRLIDEIKTFIDESLINIQQFEKIWPQVKSSVIKQLAENDTNLTMKSQRLWMAIGNDDHEFSSQSKLAGKVNEIEFEQVIQFCHRLVKTNDFGEMVLFCAGKRPNIAFKNGQVITDAAEFKRQASYII